MLNIKLNIKQTFVICVVKCQEIPEVDNGNVTCSIGSDGIFSYEDTCDVLCNLGYTLTGSSTKMCLSNGSWSGMDSVCKRGKIITKTS